MIAEAFARFRTAATLHADICDTRAFAESQLTTRIQAFMESLE